MKNCKNCAHRHGAMGWFPYCIRAGFYVRTQRQMPDESCNANFSGWEARIPFPRRVLNWLKAVTT